LPGIVGLMTKLPIAAAEQRLFAMVNCLCHECALTRPYLTRAGVERAVNGHLGGDRNNTDEIHSLLPLELTHRLFVESV
jgi:hypothetical protein